jgi:caa(3)-type oxidase subunit IV
MTTPDLEIPRASGKPLVHTLIGLLLLTSISWAISNVELGHASTPVALAIAAVKGALVIYFFMELPLASTAARIVLLVTLSFIALLCAGAVADIGLR